jgi:flavodoxin
MGKHLVVFYSRTGNTKRIAKAVSDGLQCDLEELVDTKARGGLLGYIKSGRDAGACKETEIGEIRKSPGEYDVVILGTPVWAGKMAPAIRTYINRSRDQLKGVAFVCTSGSGRPQKAFSGMEEICGQTPVATLSVSTKDVKNEQVSEAVRTFVGGFQDLKRGTGTETYIEK